MTTQELVDRVYNRKLRELGLQTKLSRTEFLSEFRRQPAPEKHSQFCEKFGIRRKPKDDSPTGRTLSRKQFLENLRNG